jgi:hypothetical protein
MIIAILAWTCVIWGVGSVISGIMGNDLATSLLWPVQLLANVPELFLDFICAIFECVEDPW